jgi:hypothetical protein
MAADAWCERRSRAATVRARSRGGDGESVELPAAVHVLGDRTRLDLLLGGGEPWNTYLL